MQKVFRVERCRTRQNGGTTEQFLFAKGLAEILGFNCPRPSGTGSRASKLQRCADATGSTTMRLELGLEKMPASAIAVALQPFQELFEKMQSEIVQLQEDTQCGYSDLDDGDMEIIEENSNSSAAPAVSVPKKPRLSKAGQVRSKVAK